MSADSQTQVETEKPAQPVIRPARSGPTSLSVGDGIAIAAIWVAATAFSAIILLTMFVWNHPTVNSDSAMSDSAVLAVLLFIALPMIAGYTLSAKIINKKVE